MTQGTQFRDPDFVRRTLEGIGREYAGLLAALSPAPADGAKLRPGQPVDVRLK